MNKKNKQMRRREMIKSSAAFAGMALASPMYFGCNNTNNKKSQIPSYLKGYEDEL